jgi:starch phosphorylase
MESNPKAFDKADHTSFDPDKLPPQYGVGPMRFAGAPDALYERRMKFDNVVVPESANSRERYKAAARAVRDVLSDRWLRTDQTYARENPKWIYYISIEFLIGRSLGNNVLNLMLDPVVERSFGEDGREWWEILHEEPDAGLGNGGLGRLAACFLDSMATLQLPAMGYGLRYEHGIFRQKIRHGWQEERPDNWLRHPDPWEVVRPAESVEVGFGCSFEFREGALHLIPNKPSTLIGVPYDRPVVGYGGHTVNTLRLWSATAAHSFDFERFSGGDFIASMAESLSAESLTRVLYPDDHTPQGRALRLMQEYFLVACSLADLIRRFRAANPDWQSLPEKAAIQLNDTHPTLAVPELMRILLDDARLGWDEAWDLTQRTLAYTNHTLLPEALERWPVDWLEILVPRHLEIIFEINRRLLDDVRTRFSGDPARAARISFVEEGEPKHIRMANLAIVGSHSTNGVAQIHSELLRTTTVRDLAEAFPERFNNKTNGVTPRRWLWLANPSLAETISGAIGDSWIADLSQLRGLQSLAGDATFQKEFSKAKRVAKARFADWVKRHTDITVDPDTIFDFQIKRIHEYKRQLLNALRVVVLYQRVRENPDLPRRAANLLLRRQGCARLLSGESHHQARQQPGSHDRQRSCFSRQIEGSLPAGIQCHARGTRRSSG